MHILRYILSNGYKESSATHDQDKLSWIECVEATLKVLDLYIFALS